MKLLITLALVLTAGTSRAADIVTAGRDVVTQHQDAIVTIKLVIKQSMSIPGRESPKMELKSETTGTVIDPTGLTVVSLSSTDPSGAAQKIMERAMAARGQASAQMKMESELNDLKLLFADGSEHAAEVVLRDKDLDLAFIRPTEALEKPVTFVNLADTATPQLLDDAIVLNRLNPTANRAIAVSLGRIEAIITKPRPSYVLGQATWGYSLGAPAFAANGKLFGIILLRTSAAQTDMTSGFMHQNLSQWGMMPVILPATDVAEGAKQAKEAKATPPEEKPATEEKPAN